MGRKIIIGITLIILAFIAFNYYPEAVYHLSWVELNSVTNLTSEINDITDITEEYYKYKYAIEKDFDNLEVWGAMSDSQKNKWIRNCHIKGDIVALLFIASGILTFTIPVRKKKDLEDESEEDENQEDENDTKTAKIDKIESTN